MIRKGKRRLLFNIGLYIRPPTFAKCILGVRDSVKLVLILYVHAETFMRAQVWVETVKT
jgi:hypothetical protein